jgi:C1A family cysteine protease
MMKKSLVLALGFGVASANGDKFEAFMEKFGREYESHYEKEYRRKVFHENLAFIEAENAKGHSYTLGVTNFADLTPPEFEAKHFTGFKPQKKKTNLSTFRAPAGFVESSSGVDWVDKGGVTAVKNQGTCGSCWTFSTTGGLEGALFVATGTLTSLSEQNILDCDTGGEKCNGGSMDQAFEWVEKNGLASEEDDSYKCVDATTSSCKTSKCPSDVTLTINAGDVTKYTDVDNSEDALEAAVTQQPVSVAIEADKTVFQYYTGGVLTSSKCGNTLDHGVLAVGYGTDAGQKYWKVKNSWGSSWGEDGYIRMAKGSTASYGECGIREMASFPTLETSKTDKFEEFVKKYGREYASQYEKEYRRKVFNENLALIDASNAKGKSYTLGVTHFADLTGDEFKSQYLTGFIPPQNTTLMSTFEAPAGYVEASSVDWVEKGAVTAVKNQGSCGSCWTFSTTGALEGANYIASGTLTSLSEQNILDCDSGGEKCNGGSMEQAFEWVKENGIASEKSDSYKCVDATAKSCKKSTCPEGGTKVLEVGDVTGYKAVKSTASALEAAVEKQPVSVAIEADKTVFQHYTAGVLTSDACGTQLDHGVLAVGFGTEDGQAYWKVKNSWGSSWGEDGYIRVEKGMSASGGECGIRKMASYPEISSSKSVIV